MRKKIDLLILVIVVISGFFAVQNAVTIGDWWHARITEPSSQAVVLAEEAGMNEEGTKLFYRFDPQVVSRSELDTKCTANKLGCAEGQSIYILSYDDEAEYNQAVVTAAHEMLHVAYSRLDESEQRTLHGLLEEELQRPSADKIRTKLSGYAEADYLNEAHSFIGTELEGISEELEVHYSQYFDDRQQVLDAYLASPH